MKLKPEQRYLDLAVHSNEFEHLCNIVIYFHVIQMVLDEC